MVQLQQDPADNKKTPELQELLSKLSKEQQGELDIYMERIKAEYLQKILDQVNL